MRQTHTYVILQVSKETYREIRENLARAGYDHAFALKAEGEVIDMQGIGLQAEGDDPACPRLVPAPEEGA